MTFREPSIVKGVNRRTRNEPGPKSWFLAGQRGGLKKPPGAIAPVKFTGAIHNFSIIIVVEKHRLTMAKPMGSAQTPTFSGRRCRWSQSF
jgi:hypothetical protein